MSLHDVIIELLYGGFPKSEVDRDRLLAAVREDQAAEVERDRPKVVANPEPAAAESRFDPTTGERL